MDNILRFFRAWCRAYVDDVITVSDTLEEHVERLHLLFDTLERYKICLNRKKPGSGSQT